MAIWEHANGLARRGHEVHVVHTSVFGEPVESLDDVTWFRFDERVEHHFCDPHEFHPAEPDVVLCVVGAPPSHLGLPLMWVQAVGAFPAFAERTMFGAPCPKLCTSSFLVEEAVRLGVRRSQAIHQPYGIRHEKYRITRALDDRTPTVAMLYYPSELKGGDLGVEALLHAKQQVPDLTAQLFGVAPSPALPRWITYDRNPPQDELVDRIYNGSRIFVLPSLVEGFGLAAVEAMASGCALVATDCGGSMDYAFHGHTALVSSRGDAAAMADHLVALLIDDELRTQIARRGAQHVRRFDWDESARRLEDTLVRYADDPGALQQPELVVGLDDVADPGAALTGRLGDRQEEASPT
jgi:glycosyltransferase involved in cell wall biosynthesis